MRAMILAAAASTALILAAAPSRSEETPTATGSQPDQLPAPTESKSDESPAAAESRPDETLAAAESKERELVLPPGFRPKKRGKFVVYCKRDAVLGTRMAAERCYDEEGIRAMLRAQAEDREKVDQMRRICGSMEQCGGGG